MAKRNPSLTVLKCAQCGATADLKTNRRAWDGWQVFPVAICPDCIEAGIQANEEKAARKKAASGSVVVIERSSHFGRTISTFSVTEAR